MLPICFQGTLYPSFGYRLDNFHWICPLVLISGIKNVFFVDTRDYVDTRDQYLALFQGFILIVGIFQFLSFWFPYEELYVCCYFMHIFSSPPPRNPLFHPLENGAPGRQNEGVKILTFLFVDGFSCMIAHFVRILMGKTSMWEKFNKH